MSVLAAAIASGPAHSTLSDVEPGVLGFLVVAGIGLVLVFLLKNMNKQFKKLGPPPEETDAESASGEAGKPGPAQDKAQPGTAQAGKVQPGTVQPGTVRTGDAKQDERAERATKRK